MFLLEQYRDVEGACKHNKFGSGVTNGISN